MIQTKEQIKKKWATVAGRAYLHSCEMLFGKYKKIQLTTTGKAYKVPTRDILMFGVKGTDLPKYPLWKDKK
jgi:hypothetical protein